MESDYDMSDDLGFSYDDDSDVDVNLTNHQLRRFEDELVAELAHDPGLWYKPWLLREFVDKRMLLALRVLESFQIAALAAEMLVMLQNKRWQPDEVALAFYEDPERLYRECGLPYPFDPKSYQLKSTKDFDCFICAESYPEVLTYNMGCGHQYCVECYATYIGVELPHGNLIKCMSDDCQLTIPHTDAEAILAAGDDHSSGVKPGETPLAENRVLLHHAKMVIAKDRTRYKWCPAIDCRNFVEIVEGEVDPRRDDPKNTTVPVVKCLDGHEYCFRCIYENHLPCPCWITARWIKKCEDDSETANWIEANTHNCPGCGGAIEKNGGCNHMVCRTCKREFCWICHEEWLSHTNYYKCNRYRAEEPDREEQRNAKRELLNRYLHFYKRFSIHELSMKGDRKTVEQVETIARLYMEDVAAKDSTLALSWNDIQFLPDAIRALTNGRKTLKWTYAFAYYLDETNFSHIFEDNQNYLNQTVEELLGIFEKIVDKKNKVMVKATTTRIDTILSLKSQIINLSSLIQSRQRSLIAYAQENLESGLLKFDQ